MGILKCNAIVGQSGGPTAAINATLAGVIRGCIECGKIDTLYGAFNGVEGILCGRYCNLNEVFADIKDIEKLENTPAAALGSCRVKLPNVKDIEKDEKAADIYKKLFKFFEENNIHYFFYIGGNDSMDTVAKVSEYARICGYDICVMGVPKTIDNDLCGTDHTPGYGSAAKYIAASLQEIIRDCAVYTLKAVTIVEIMGRDAGWLTASAALTGYITGSKVDLIYLPEVIFDYDKFYEDVSAALSDHPNVVIAVSEGIRLADGTLVGEDAQSGAVDSFGHKYLSGTGKVLEKAVKNKLGCKVRSVELNILQRCASHIASKTDLCESVMIGKAAVMAAANGETAKMAMFIRNSGDTYEISVDFENISNIANKVKDVPRNFINERGNNVTDECVEYILPLVQGETCAEYKNGLPVHFEIKR